MVKYILSEWYVHFFARFVAVMDLEKRKVVWGRDASSISMAFSSCRNATLSITLVTKKTPTSNTNQILSKLPNSGRPNGSYPICKRLFFPGLYLVPFRVTELHSIISAAAGKSSWWNRSISHHADSLSFPRRLLLLPNITSLLKRELDSALPSTSSSTVIFLAHSIFWCFNANKSAIFLKFYIFFG